MNRIAYLGIVLLCSMGLFGQTSIPNGDFENWTTLSYDNPSGFPFSANDEMVRRGSSTFNVTKTTDKRTGTYALQLETIKVGDDTLNAYLVNGEPKGENPTEWKGTKPISGTPTGITGYYKYNQATTDSIIAIITFSKAGVQIGMYMGRFGGLKAAYTAFSIPFIPALPMAPDSVTIAFASSDEFKGILTPGAIAKLDDLSFTGIAIQPAWLDGGFETWTTKNIDTAADWYSEDGNAVKTSNKFSGSYAAQLTTTLGSNKDNVPLARAGRLSNGWYPDNCGGGCQQLGGVPCTKQKDTLVFRYKYTPSSLDTAQVYIRFKKGGVNFWDNGQSLTASVSFKEVKIPWDLFQAPDSIIINFESSSWEDSAIVFVGSTLIIDDIHLASDRAATGLFNLKKGNVQLSPNPASSFTVIKGIENATISIISMQGSVVLKSAIIPSNGIIDLNGIGNGNYLVLIDTGKGIISEKLIIKK